MKSQIFDKYKKEVVPALEKKFGYANIMEVPKILKVSINAGINSRNTDSNLLETVENTLARITGQKPIRAKSRAAISAFKVKENMVVGVAVTLRGQKMYDFLDKFILISLPRIRDFRGVNPKSIDKQGNMSIGLKEHIVFPEIRSDEVERIHGLQINITTTAGSYEVGKELFTLLGFPMQK